MTDSKVRPAAALLPELLRSYHVRAELGTGTSVYPVSAVVSATPNTERVLNDWRTEADAAGYQRAVGEILTLLEEESDSWAYAQHQLLPHGHGSQNECNRLLKLIRRRFGDGSKG
jgi:hypothetical protein